MRQYSMVPTNETEKSGGPYHGVDELGFQSSHANFVNELVDKGGVFASLRVAHHPKHQCSADQYRDVVASDAMLFGRNNFFKGSHTSVRGYSVG